MFTYSQKHFLFLIKKKNNIQNSSLRSCVTFETFDKTENAIH